MAWLAAGGGEAALAFPSGWVCDISSGRLGGWLENAGTAEDLINAGILSVCPSA